MSSGPWCWLRFGTPASDDTVTECVQPQAELNEHDLNVEPFFYVSIHKEMA